MLLVLLGPSKGQRSREMINGRTTETKKSYLGLYFGHFSNLYYIMKQIIYFFFYLWHLNGEITLSASYFWESAYQF